MKGNTDEFDEGALAFNQDKDKCDNPYSHSSYKAKQWENGWNAALFVYKFAENKANG